MLQSIDPNTLCMGCMSSAATGSFCPECGWPQAKDNHSCQLPIRTILAGKYLVGRVLGQGGFGITYLGWDLNLDMKVAIKEYYPESLVNREPTGRTLVQCFSGESQQYFSAGREKFVQEAKLLARFDDLPGVVSVKDFFMENGTAYIVMKFIQGETLKSHIADDGNLAAGDALKRLYPLMNSLAQIHATGLIHRDISPDNIILEPDGGIKLLDFGAARSMSLTGEHSSTINVKKGYAPPEQYRAHGEQGPWTDVYALAATIYKTITGKTPPQSLDREVKDFLQPPTALGAELTWWQEAAILKGMATRIENRYPSVAAFAKDLYSVEAPAGLSPVQEVPPVQIPVQQPVQPAYSYNPSQQPQGGYAPLNPQGHSYNPSQGGYIPVQQPVQQGYSYDPSQQLQGHSYNPSQGGYIPVQQPVQQGYSYDPAQQGGVIPEPPVPEKEKKPKKEKPPKPPKEPKPPKPPKEPKPQKPQKQEDPFNEPKKKLGTGAIAGIIGGAAVFLIVLILLLVLPDRNKQPSATTEPADTTVQQSPYLVDAMSVFNGAEYSDEWLAEAASMKTAMIHTEESYTYDKISEGLLAFKAKTGSECVEITAEVEELREAVGAAIEWGATNIFLCEEAYKYEVYHLQQEYPEIIFIQYDAQPTLYDAQIPPYEQTKYIAPNTLTVYFTEGHLGYLAGRLAVERGYTRLAYAGCNVWAANGFLQGANEAAIEKGIEVFVDYSIMAVTETDAMDLYMQTLIESAPELLFVDFNDAPGLEGEFAETALEIGCDYICTYPEVVAQWPGEVENAAACVQRNYQFSTTLLLDLIVDTRLSGTGEFGERLYLGADVLGVDVDFTNGMEEQRDALNNTYEALLNGTSMYLDPAENPIEDLFLSNLVVTEYSD